MRTATILLGVLLIASLLPGCYTKCKRKVEDQEQVIREKQAKISELERKQEELKAEVKGNEAFMRELRKKVGNLKGNKKILLQQIEDKTLITLPNAILFSPGSTTLSKRGGEALKLICEVLNNYPDRPICIEGHTDNILISPRLRERYTTNWELSVARAIQVMYYMVGPFEIEQRRVSVKGCGPFRPIASNSTPEGQADNRRVVIVIDPK